MAYTSTDKNINDAVGSARAAYDSAGDAASDLGQQAGKIAANAGAAVRDAAGRVSEAAADMGDKVYKRGMQASQQVSKQVELQPLSSILVAASAGFVVGLLMARR